MSESPEEIAIGIGEWVAESIINDVGFNPDLCLAALKKAESLIIKAAGIDPISYYKRVFEEVQNAIDREEIC